MCLECMSISLVLENAFLSFIKMFELANQLAKRSELNLQYFCRQQPRVSRKC